MKRRWGHPDRWHIHRMRSGEWVAIAPRTTDAASHITHTFAAAVAWMAWQNKEHTP